ncbi:Wadjet anti-phage system protein JetD domain-containing protein [Saccharothrix variisporea]|uniref:Wadjet anti-phage system protein JetD domain-containing protein n=1 Tax=Saccharothrix variisporea TaxID=543527 RepID=UPI000EB51F85
MLRALTPGEAALYRDLVEGAFGESVRLEQERIRYSAISAALGALGSGRADRGHQVREVDPQPVGEVDHLRR